MPAPPKPGSQTCFSKVTTVAWRKKIEGSGEGCHTDMPRNTDEAPILGSEHCHKKQVREVIRRCGIRTQLQYDDRRSDRRQHTTILLWKASKDPVRKPLRISPRIARAPPSLKVQARTRKALYKGDPVWPFVKKD